MSGEDEDWKDTNVGGIGTEEDKSLRKKAASTEECWAVAGKEAGVQVWRIEQFKVVPSEEGAGGSFHKGDSYIVLHTEKGEHSPKSSSGDVFIHSIYYYIGGESSQDEYGTAAYKAVELDDFFDGEPTQHREEMEKESEAFKGLFESLTYLDGGVATGFNHVERKGSNWDREVRMYSVRQVQHKGKAHASRIDILSVPLNTSVLHKGDCFVLDTPAAIYVLDGPACSAKEKFEANQKAELIESKREDGIAATHEIDEGFWKALEGPKPDWVVEPKKVEAAPAVEKVKSETPAAAPAVEKVKSDKPAAAPAPAAAAAPAAPKGDGSTHSLDALKAGCPDGVDPTTKELALSDAEFKDVFKMSKAEWAGVPKWKQQSAKKNAGLF